MKEVEWVGGGGSFRFQMDNKVYYFDGNLKKKAKSFFLFFSELILYIYIFYTLKEI